MSTAEIILLGLGSAGLILALICHLKARRSFLIIPGHDRREMIRVFHSSLDQALDERFRQKIADQQPRHLFWSAMKWRVLVTSAIILFIWWVSWRT